MSARRIALGAAVAIGLLGLGGYADQRRWIAGQAERLDAGSQLVETRLGLVEYALAGDLERTLLVVHGTPGGYDQAAGIAPLAVARGYRLLRVSRPGYLRTDLSVGRTPEEQADVYAALLDALGIERVAIMGISGGGPSALHFAARHPARCAALLHTMGVSRARLEEESRREQRTPAWVGGLFASDFGGGLVVRALPWLAPNLLEAMMPDPALRERILSDPAKLAGFSAMLRSGLVLPSRRQAGLANDHEQFERMSPPPLAQIRTPTLVIHGTADRSVPLAMGRLVAEQVPGAEILEIERADHLALVSHSEPVFSEAFDFVDRSWPAR